MSMESIGLENTLPLSDRLLNEAWLDYVAGVEPIISVPAFLDWLRHHRPHVLECVNRPTVVKVAAHFCEIEQQRRSLRSDIESISGN